MRFTLRHTWSSASDRAALAVCAEALAAHGIEFADADAAGTEPPSAIKWHGHEMVDARRDGTRLLDLSQVALEERWADRVPALVQRFSREGAQWHGLPMGVHRANTAWFSTRVMRAVGAEPPIGWPQWLAWLQAARTHVAAPLAVGAAPYQIGLLFENAVIAIAGEAMHRRAFVSLDPDVLASPAIVESIEELQRLREFVSDESLSLSTPEHTERVRRGEAAVQVMADWLAPGAGPALRGAPVPGTHGHVIAVADFFVPLHTDEAAAADTAMRAAAVLGRPDVLRRFAEAKGCTPPDVAAFGDLVVVPSLTFDQACGVAMKQALLEVVARAFVERADARGTAALLADVVA